MKKHKYIVPAVIVILTYIATSCKTDFSLNAPYEAIPVVYGVLDQSTDTQFVKINKSFLGSGNNAEYAAILDSNYFQNLSGTVDEYVNGTLNQSFTLHDLWVKNIDAGIFNTDSQKVYYFIPTSGLNEDATYKLNVNVSEVSDPITAETDLVKGSQLAFGNIFTLTSIYSGIKFADAQTLVSGNYQNITPDWLSIQGGKIYELYLRFNFVEITATDTTNKSIVWNLGSQTSTNTDGNESLSKTINGESFYDMVANKLAGYENEAAVIKRKVKKIDFLLAAGADELNTYISVNEPTTGVVTSKPTYTNIDNGVGIFSSRMNIKESSSLDVHSTYVLCKGAKTSGLKFCTDSSNFLITYPDITCN